MQSDSRFDADWYFVALACKIAKVIPRIWGSGLECDVVVTLDLGHGETSKIFWASICTAG
jgi:hypothetical protein